MAIEVVDRPKVQINHHSHQFGGERCGGLEALRVENDLGDEGQVGLAHRHRPEELLQVVGQLGTTAVALARRVHGHKDPWPS